MKIAKENKTVKIEGATDYINESINKSVLEINALINARHLIPLELTEQIVLTALAEMKKKETRYNKKNGY